MASLMETLAIVTSTWSCSVTKLKPSNDWLLCQLQDYRKIQRFPNQQSHKGLHRYPAGTGCQGFAQGPPAAGGIVFGGCIVCQQLQTHTATAGRQKEMSTEKQVNDNYSQSPGKPGHRETCIQFWALLQTCAVTLDSSCNFTALVFSLLTRAHIE